MPFSALELHPTLLNNIKTLGFAKPTPVQSEAIPPAIAGRDVLACAMTGSGKTAAFVLPMPLMRPNAPKAPLRPAQSFLRSFSSRASRTLRAPSSRQMSAARRAGDAQLCQAPIYLAASPAARHVAPHRHRKLQ